MLNRISPSARQVYLAAAVGAAAATTAHADIFGFNFFNGWSYNTGDAGSPPQFQNADSVEFTTGTDNRRSVWYTTPQDISQFTVNFTYRASNIAASAQRQGMTFAIQTQGLDALGGGGNDFGYAGISPSSAITIELDTGPGLTYSGSYTNGVVGGGSNATTPVNGFDVADIDVTIVYSGTLLSVTMSQAGNSAPPRQYFVGSLPGTLGSSTAFVGFTAGTFNRLGGAGGARQFISDFSYVVPAPPAAAALLLGLGTVARRRR